MEIQSKFSMTDWMESGLDKGLLKGLGDIYTCSVTSANILQPGTNIKVGGQHQKDKTNDDVRGIDFFRLTVHYIPKGLSEVFPHLTHLAIDNCGLKKICRQDLIGLENLITLEAERNFIEVLADDLFADMKSLKHIDFFQNEISSISPKVLEPIKHQLEFADFRQNKSVDFSFSRSSVTSIDDLIKYLDNKDLQSEESQEKSKSEDFLERLWTTGNFSDLTVFAGDKQFKAHKTVLAVHSPVFARMFDQQPKFEEGQPRIDFSAEATEEALEHLYTGKLPSAVKTAEVLELAIKYEMQELKKSCVKIIEKHTIDESNVLDVLELANRCGILRMKARAFEFIKLMFPGKTMDDTMAENIELLKEMIEAKRKFYLLCKD